MRRVQASSYMAERQNMYNEAGDWLGSTDNIMIDKRSGQVRYALLEFGGFLGMGTDLYPMPWDMLQYDTQMEGYVVPLDKATLKGAQKYAESEAPPYPTAYRQQVTVITASADPARRRASACGQRAAGSSASCGGSPGRLTRSELMLVRRPD